MAVKHIEEIYVPILCFTVEKWNPLQFLYNIQIKINATTKSEKKVKLFILVLIV